VVTHHAVRCVGRVRFQVSVKIISSSI
jgi:hypothetical protein